MNFIEKVKVVGNKLVEKPKSESEYRDAAHSIGRLLTGLRVGGWENGCR